MYISSSHLHLPPTFQRQTSTGMMFYELGPAVTPLYPIPRPLEISGENQPFYATMPFSNGFPNMNHLYYSWLDDPLYPIYEGKAQPQHSPLVNFQPQQTPGYFPAKNRPGFILDSFKTKDGHIDYNKLFAAAGQLMGALNQFSALIKGVHHLFKT